MSLCMCRCVSVHVHPVYVVRVRNCVNEHAYCVGVHVNLNVWSVACRLWPAHVYVACESGCVVCGLSPVACARLFLHVTWVVLKLCRVRGHID